MDRRLAELEGDEIDVSVMLTRQRERHEAAWERLQARVSPRQARMYRQKLDRLAIASKTRESVRSEAVRLLSVFRTFALRAGELTGLGTDVFFLVLDEVLVTLAGDGWFGQFIAARKGRTPATAPCHPIHQASVAGSIPSIGRPIPNGALTFTMPTNLLLHQPLVPSLALPARRAS